MEVGSVFGVGFFGGMVGCFCRVVVWLFVSRWCGVIGLGLVWFCVRCAHELDWNWFFFSFSGSFLGNLGHDVRYMGEGLRGGGAG
jgi:hypothetical protein